MSWSEKVAKEEEAMKVLEHSFTRCFCWMVKDDHLVEFTTKYEGLGGDEGCSARGGHWGLGTLCGDFRKVRGNQRREG